MICKEPLQTISYSSGDARRPEVTPNTQEMGAGDRFSEARRWQGGPGTIATVSAATRNGTPVLLLKGRLLNA